MIGTRATVLAGFAAAVGVQVGPAATWLSPVRRTVAPGLSSPMPKGSVAITFDDGPHPDGTPAVLATLDRLGWSATFFVLGSAARRHPELVREIRDRGHVVGLHGDDHRYLLARWPRGQVADLRRARDTVEEITGSRCHWWRPPYGVLTGPSLAVAKREGLRPILWSAWGRDWEPSATPDSIARRVARGSLDGGTVLLHDSDISSSAGSWLRTVGALGLIAERIADRGIEVRPFPAR